jgi:hypothetical protein
MSEEQHDDHVWLTVGGSAWAIFSIQWPIIFLWRGNAIIDDLNNITNDSIECNAIDIRNVDWESYYKNAMAILYDGAGQSKGWGWER